MNMMPYRAFEGDLGRKPSGQERLEVIDRDDENDVAVMYNQLPQEKGEEKVSLMERLDAVLVELEMKNLELGLQEQKYIEKENECEKIKENRDRLMEIKEKELQEAKNEAEDLRHRLELLTKRLEKSLEKSLDHSSMDEMGSNEEIDDLLRSDILSFFQEEKSTLLETEAGGSDVCPFCLRSILDAQTWTFHFANCPDSQKWHGQDMKYYSTIITIESSANDSDFDQ